uniref:Ferritin n=1 Tax=Moschus moschiferus TaxID=68415 RepID=A0A8C6FVT0_MOSMO
NRTGCSPPAPANYQQASETSINRQINLELYASYVYLPMSYYFDHDVVLQNQRGGRIFLQNIKKPDHDDWENGLNARECALCLERSANQSLLELYKLATGKNDPHLCDFIETHYLNKQVEAIKELGDHVTTLCKMGHTLGHSES